MEAVRVVFVVFALGVLAIACGLAYCSQVGWLRFEFPDYDRHDLNITFTQEANESLRSAYLDGAEIHACLSADYLRQEYGSEHYDKAYKITGVKDLVVGEEHSVSHTVCNTLADVHTHPKGSCWRSNGDIVAWKNDARQGVQLFAIMCSEHKIAFYTVDDMSRGQEYEI